MAKYRPTTKFGSPSRFDPTGAPSRPAFIGTGPDDDVKAAAAGVRPKPKAAVRPPAGARGPVGTRPRVKPPAGARGPVGTTPTASAPKPKAKVLPASHPAQPSAAVPIAKVTKPSVSSAPRPPKQKPLAPTQDKPAPKPAPRQPAAPPAPQAPVPTAAQQVDALLAPQYNVLATQEQQREAALKQFTDAMLSQLKGVPDQIAGDYGTAQQAINGYAQTAATGLANMNPNADTQALLQAIGAPQAQQDAVTQQNNNVFGGGAGVLYARDGMLPAQQTAADQASAMAFARALPTIQALAATQGLRGFQQQNAVAQQQIAAQRPDLIMKAQANQVTQANADRDYNLRVATYNQNAEALGLKGRQQAFNNKVTIAKLNQADARTQVSIDKFNATQKAKASKIDVGVTKQLNDGFAHNSEGNVVYIGGKPVSYNPQTSKVTTKLPSSTQVSRLVDQWKNGKVVTVNVPSPNPDSNGNPTTHRVSTQSGQLNFGQAYKRLRAMGYGDQKARQFLDSAYMRGEQGRAWLTNEEQYALGRVKLPTKARIIQGHGVLSAAQVTALSKAGKLPPGIMSQGGYVISQTY